MSLYLRLASPLLRSAQSYSNFALKNLSPCRSFLTGRSPSLLQNVQKVSLPVSRDDTKFVLTIIFLPPDKRPPHSPNPILHKAGPGGEGPQSRRVLAARLFRDGVRGGRPRWDRRLRLSAVLRVHCDCGSAAQIC